MAEVLLQSSLALLAAGLTAWFAVFTYFRQREHELILSRYLESGLDLLAAEVERVSETFSHNWARCLLILKSYRDLEDQYDVGELSKGFLELQSSKHNIVAHHRLYTLTGAREYWDFYQKAMAYYTSANSVLVKEIPEVIRVKLTSDRNDTPHADIMEHGFTVAKEQDDGSHKYVQLVAELQILSAALECERYRFKDLSKFRNKPEVQESLQRIKGLLASLEEETDAQQL
ncbi:MAG: hypothetical protein ACREVK_10900 [Gammaproteobacteria bacterium]